AAVGGLPDPAAGRGDEDGVRVGRVGGDAGDTAADREAAGGLPVDDRSGSYGGPGGGQERAAFEGFQPRVPAMPPAENLPVPVVDHGGCPFCAVGGESGGRFSRTFDDPGLPNGTRVAALCRIL